MTLDDCILDLLLRWEELREKGQQLTPEELCRDSPHLLDEIKNRIRDLDRVPSLVSTLTENASADSAQSPGDPCATLVQHGASPLVGTHGSPTMRYGQEVFHAEGGLGKVFKARDAELGRQVALKRMKDHVARSSESRRRFLREAEITGRLEHPGIVPVYGLVHDERGHPCYAMRFIEGDSLKDAINRFHEADKGKRDPGERSLALRQLINQFIAVCKTIAYAHSRGIIHRDIKPGNIMLGKYGETLVVDWGLARPFGRTETERSSGEQTLMPNSDAGEGSTRMGHVIGTPEYMSPEQAAGRLDVMGPPSDVYSLGATLYTLLTGQPSVTGLNDPEKLQKVQQGNIRRISEMTSGIPKPLEAICMKAIALRPPQRYATALELADELERWQGDEVVRAYKESAAAKLVRWARRHRPLVASLAVLLITTSIAMAVGIVLSQQQKEIVEAKNRDLKREKE
jgi:eukaryotic-like serine/threonine-protein kinase